MASFALRTRCAACGMKLAVFKKEREADIGGENPLESCGTVVDE